ncbi:uncharacterized protein LOC144157896 isoform X2 [Haemaphysalis longicornis]
MGSKRPCLAFLMLVLLRNCVALSVEEEALYNQVLVPGYSKSSPPRTADNKTDVFIQLEVIFVGDVRESWLDFKLNAWVSLLWRDSRVDATLLRQLGHRTMPEFLARSVWQPSVVFESAGQVTRFDESDVYVRDDDFLLLRQRIVFHVLCLAQEDTFILGGTVCSLVVKLVHNADSAASLVWVGDDSASPFFGQHESIVLQEGIRPLSYRLVKVEPSQHEHEESSRAIGHPPAVTASFHFSKVRHNRIASPYSSQLQPGDVWFFMSAVMVFCSLLEFVVAHNAYRAQVRAQNAGVTSASASSTSIADPRYHVYRKPPAMVALTVMCDVGSQTNRSYLAYRPNDVDMLARVIFPVAFVLVASGYFLWYAASDK